MDAGVPSWSDLVDAALAALSPDDRDEVSGDARFSRARADSDVPKAFSRIVKVAGREVVNSAITRSIGGVTQPGRLHLEIADWPFRGYITTNYDGLLEAALKKNGQVGWLSVGNTSAELPTVAGDPDRCVWHIHGSSSTGADRSTLVVTEEDYDEIYAEDTPLVQSLRGLITHNRLVFIGFGLSDPHFMRLLHRIGRFSNPARPIYAFSHIDDPDKRADLYERHNVDVIPYQVLSGSHDRLNDLVRTYGGLVVRRSLTFREPLADVPSHDPETTGLFLYNELLLQRSAPAPMEVVDALLKSRVLALASTEAAQTVKSVLADLDARAGGLGRGRKAGDQQRILETLRLMRNDGLLAFKDAGGTLSLTDDGQAFVKNQVATAHRLREQFATALRDRVSVVVSDADAKERVVHAAYAFITDCIERRALGVALATWNLRADARKYQMMALLHDLPSFMNQLNDEGEAIALTQIVQDVLAEPTEPERRFVGIALQAQFGVHMLGVDPGALEARIASVSRSVYVVDSNVLIDFLARSSTGFESARLLIARLQNAGAYVTTTGLLCCEVVGHAEWALAQIDQDSGALRAPAMRSMTGHAGDSTNSFLEGFAEEVARGAYGLTDLCRYIQDTLGAKSTSKHVGEDDVANALIAAGIHVDDVDAWDGFELEFHAEVEEASQEITTLRKAKETYNNERQVKAEAEVFLLVTRARDGSLSPPGRDGIKSAHFISNTGLLDSIRGTNLPVTMRPESALSLVTTLVPLTINELGAMSACLLAGLDQSGLTLMDKSRILRAFNPLIETSRQNLEAELKRHEVLLAEHYGEAEMAAFADVDPVEIPLVLNSLYCQEADFLGTALDAERKRTKVLEARSSLTDAERNELERLRSAFKLRAAAGRSKKRAAQSRPPGRRKRGRGK